MKRETVRRTLRAAAVLLALFLLCLLLYALRPPCLILSSTGYYCAGCGTQRMIASLLQGLQGGGNAGSGAPPAGGNAGAAPSAGGGMPDLGSIGKLAGVLGTMNQPDKNIDLLQALKPHFSPERAGKIDGAVRLMRLMHAWPAVRDSGLLGSLGNLFSGGGKR